MFLVVNPLFVNLLMPLVVLMVAGSAIDLSLCGGDGGKLVADVGGLISGLAIEGGAVGPACFAPVPN
ncbi:hypothetical protein RchiOBHm_Chr5g0024651 [Rosa chinensis]|uniref:Uncharacterized protein n=1 Tax=Rosa chinensis TaxID=74649 RepID=A0A2P6Q8D7_ROSCH|nr:hypothetical protein RchiOBHm_Chr5g0024651 [Rosa chinensis]